MFEVNIFLSYCYMTGVTFRVLLDKMCISRSKVRSERLTKAHFSWSIVLNKDNHASIEKRVNKLLWGSNQPIFLNPVNTLEKESFYGLMKIISRSSNKKIVLKRNVNCIQLIQFHILYFKSNATEIDISMIYALNFIYIMYLHLIWVFL